MKSSRHDNCDDVVDLLVKDYWSKSRSDLDQTIAKIGQDFVSRHLFNSTIRISCQLHTEFEYVNMLIDYVIESLEKNFSHIPSATCKNKLLTIVEREYKKLIPKTTSRLVESNLGQKGTVESYERGILDEMEKSKEKVEIQCAISQEEGAAATEKADGEGPSQGLSLKTAKLRFITAIICLTTAIVGFLVFLVSEVLRDSDTNTRVSTETEKRVDSSTSITTTLGRTHLYARTKKRAIRGPALKL